MDKSKKKKTTQEDSQKDSQSNYWWQNITVTKEQLDAFKYWEESWNDLPEDWAYKGETIYVSTFSASISSSLYLVERVIGHMWVQAPPRRQHAPVAQQDRAAHF